MGLVGRLLCGSLHYLSSDICTPLYLHGIPVSFYPPLSPCARNVSGMDLVGRLRGIYERILGDSSSLRIVTTPSVPDSDLLQRDVCTVQVRGEECVPCR